MESEWIRIEEAARILGLSTSGIFYRKSVGLLETRKERYGSYEWLLFRRSQCEEQAANPPQFFRQTSKLRADLPQWSEVEIAQLATFIDCEGCIAIHCNRNVPGAKNPSHALRLMVANTYYPVIEMLRERFGGQIQSQNRTLKNPKWKPHYRWWTGSSHALLLLELAEPYFVIKQEEAAVAIAFQRRINEYDAGRPRRTPVSPEEVAWRQEQMDRLSELKRRVVDHRSGIPKTDSD
jgi:hypothetical protein